uniref:Shisa like 2A n=1 Tax=Cyprinus carpio TaxID=7962 RepID=A0A8C1ND63_CYPCA
MSADCAGYYNADNVFVSGFTCPKHDSDALAIFCCGFNDVKYCCDDPNSFFPYEYGYMWWLSLGALVGLSIAAVVLLAFIITICVLCYLFIATKPRGLDNGLLQICLPKTKAEKKCINCVRKKKVTFSHTSYNNFLLIVFFFFIYIIVAIFTQKLRCMSSDQ